MNFSSLGNKIGFADYSLNFVNTEVGIVIVLKSNIDAIVFCIHFTVIWTSVFTLSVTFEF